MPECTNACQDLSWVERVLLFPSERVHVVSLATMQRPALANSPNFRMELAFFASAWSDLQPFTPAPR